MERKGFVKLHRQFLDWEWYDDVPTKTLFIHLLLTVNFEEGKWQGRIVKRGSCITSLKKLAEATKLSIRQTRTALKHLEATQEITKISTPKYTEILINNYDKYQQVTNKATNKRQTNDTLSDKQTTTIKEYNTTYYKEEKKKKNSAATSAASEGGESQPLTTWDMQKELGVDA